MADDDGSILSDEGSMEEEIPIPLNTRRASEASRRASEASRRASEMSRRASSGTTDAGPTAAAAAAANAAAANTAAAIATEYDGDRDDATFGDHHPPSSPVSPLPVNDESDLTFGNVNMGNNSSTNSANNSSGGLSNRILSAVGRVSSRASLASNRTGNDSVSIAASQYSYGSVGGVPRTAGAGQQKRRTSIKAMRSVMLDALGEVATVEDGGADGESLDMDVPGALPSQGMPVGDGVGGGGGRGPGHRSTASRGAGNVMFSVVSRATSRVPSSSVHKRSGVGSGSTAGGNGGAGASRAGSEGSSAATGSTMGVGGFGKGLRSTFAFKKRATRTGPQGGSNASSQPSSAGSGGRREAASLDALAQLEGANGWESVAAAAALVASEADAAKASSKHRHRYGVGDRVLVSLTVMNATLGGAVASDMPFDAEEEGESVARERIEQLKESSTLIPVNKHGFPPGGAPVGSPPLYFQGPYGYVLATVARVHFEEDAQYYTVTRADTETEQRSDAEWMYPLPASQLAYESALKAAQTTKKTVEDEKKRLEPAGKRGLEWLKIKVWNRCVGAYRSARVHTKVQTAKFLYGNTPYSFDLQFTGVNFLVLCSVIYMFIDNIRLAFFSRASDWAIMIIMTVVWSILVIELLFEVLVRPEGYSALMASEKAYAPSTARFINAFHLFFEVVSLICFVPDFRCLATGDCGATVPFSLMEASLNSVLGPSVSDAVRGHLYFVTLRLRVFNLVRHWKKMWINHTFDEPVDKGSHLRGYWVPAQGVISLESQRGKILTNKKTDDAQISTRSIDDSGYDEDAEEEKATKEQKRQAKRADKRLSKAATIGTALMVVNSHRAMILIVTIVSILPVIFFAAPHGSTNPASYKSVELLQANNLLVTNTDDISCQYLETAINAWVASLAKANVDSNDYRGSERTATHLLWAQLLPARCGIRDDGVITLCPPGFDSEICDDWGSAPADEVSADSIAQRLGLRTGVVASHSIQETVNLNGNETVFLVSAMFNEGHSVAYANFSSFLLQFCMLCLILLGLTVLRGDAGQLVLDPLRRMLKIVLRYASNPLAQAESKRKKKKARSVSDDDMTIDSDSDIEYAEKNQLGNYETEQLIRAIARITDLLRKCWGVAGANIISTNLARTQDGKTVLFNPTVAGRRVYALFGFCGITDFPHLLRNLDQDVMNLINDVAKIVHEEVYRWGLGDSGQCNKNLGAAFLMVYRIGDFKEVEEKKARATEVIFTSSEEKSKKTSQAVKRRGRGARKKKTDKELDTLQLASLPGIQAFTDRALLGMLKSFAGLHRDQSIMKWSKDFRLGAGVDAFSLGLLYGMDAGWGVEGAVGSEFKIDATYLSPHVNMASRMMSACKQYGVNILLSQAVEKLLSHQARSKLRHVDTVTVKGSTLAQQIFTYDSRHRGVDFYLFGRSPAQADADSDSYTPNIWNTDQDLKAMRQHISSDFERAFTEGRKAYISGKWDHAISRLEIANRCMIQTALDEGFHEYDVQGFDDQLLKPETPNDEEELIRLREELGDGPCRSLLAYMKQHGGVAPKSWRGVRPLTSK